MISQKERLEMEKKRKEAKEKLDKDMGRLRMRVAEAQRNAQSRAAITAATRQKIDERLGVKTEPAKNGRPAVVLSLRAQKGLEIIKTVDEKGATPAVRKSYDNAVGRIENLMKDHLRTLPMDTLERRVKGAELLVARHPNEPKYHRNLEILREVVKEKKKG